MSLFLMVFLASLLSWGVVSLVIIGCLIFAVWEYRKKQAQKTADFIQNLNNFNSEV